jgi:hypothetical protein
MSDNGEISPEGRAARFAQWEEIGVEAIRADLESGGHQYVGGPPEVHVLAWEWVLMKDGQKVAAAKEVVSLRPTLYGVSIDLKEVGRKIKRWLRRDSRP